MADRIPTKEVERLVADGELLPIVTSISADAHFRLLHQRRDLAADLLDARRAEATARAVAQRLLNGWEPWLGQEAAEWLDTAEELQAEPMTDQERVFLAGLRAALSEEET